MLGSVDVLFAYLTNMNNAEIQLAPSNKQRNRFDDIRTVLIEANKSLLLKCYDNFFEIFEICWFAFLRSFYDPLKVFRKYIFKFISIDTFWQSEGLM